MKFGKLALTLCVSVACSPGRASNPNVASASAQVHSAGAPMQSAAASTQSAGAPSRSAAEPRGAGTAAPHARGTAEPRFASATLTVFDASAHFAAEGVRGAFVGFDARRAQSFVHEEALSRTGYLPASTFKIANAAIALESGIVGDAGSVLAWDGVRRWHPLWNLDLSLAAAFQSSAVPHFQALARRVGEQPMRSWLERFEYGNRDPGGALDRFWLEGALRISAFEQVDFLQRLCDGRLPVSARTRDIVREVMFVGARGAARLYGKTGSTGPVANAQSVGWFVGWIEHEGARFYFATLLLDPAADAGNARLQVTDRVLSSLHPAWAG